MSTQSPFKRHAQNGLTRSASLLRALGAKAAPVWAELTPEDAAAITAEMEKSPISPEADEAAASAFLAEASQLPGQIRSIWARLSDLDTDQLASLLTDEHPQVIALILTRIKPQAAAALVRQFPSLLATDILHRMLHMAPVNTAALSAIETDFENRLNTRPAKALAQPDMTVARIFDELPDETGETLLNALHTAEPGVGERIRALMFTFTDLASLSPAGLQTLLSKTSRDTLTLALKGVSGDVGEAFYSNMTLRAREVLTEEIEALGPRPKREIDSARAELVTLARKLMETGDIRPGDPEQDGELIA